MVYSIFEDNPRKVRIRNRVIRFMRKKYWLLYLIIFIFLGCSSSRNIYNSTSLSGEIFNPQSSELVILKNDKIIDTVPLDKYNQFHYRFDKNKVQKGLYTILHDYQTHYETQMFYVEPGDSLRLRLNTQEFDESLMYSGEGAVANNFLMVLFLDNQEHNKLLLYYYKVDPREFIQKIDSIKSDYQGYIDNLYAKGDFSKDFRNIAKEIVNYADYDTRERYYFLLNKYDHTKRDNLPDNFLAYREEANFNNQDLQKYYIYQYFLDDYLKNISIEDCQRKSKLKDRKCFDLYSKANLNRRMELTDSLFKLPTLRNRFLRDFGGWLIVNSKSKQEVDSTLSFLNHVDFDKEELHRMKELGQIQKKQFIGNIGEVELNSPEGELVPIHSIIHKPTLIYYWSLYYKSLHINQHRRINELKKEHPEIDIVGINIDYRKPGADSDSWITEMKDFGYNTFNEYRISCSPEQQTFYRNYLNKMVLINKNSVVLEANLDINDGQLEEKINHLVKEL